MGNTIVAFDTNIWIYLAIEPELEPIFNQIKEYINNGTISIIANNIILAEWERNKSNTIETAVKNYKKINIVIKNMADAIIEPDQKEAFAQGIKQFNSGLSDSVERKVNDVEALLAKCVCTNATDEQKLHIANLAINNRPPFQHSKNNFNDALIIRNLCQYVSDNIEAPSQPYEPEQHFIYVSNNPKDFTDQTTHQIYQDILEGIELNFSIVNKRSLPDALHLSKELSSEYDEWLDYAESQILNQMYYEWEISKGK